MRSLDFSQVSKSTQLVDDRGRLRRFPSRIDYVNSLVTQGIVADDADFRHQEDLVKAVYFDWLKRGQVGCIFAQLFGRMRNRGGLSTVVVATSDELTPSELARHIDSLVDGSISGTETNAISVLLPGVRDAVTLTNLMVHLSTLEGWQIELEMPWRTTMIMVGLRRYLSEDIWAEVLGLGPFQFLPPTRQSPITSLELRTSPEPAPKSKTSDSMRAAHLAQLTADFLTVEQYKTRRTLTKGWRTRILGGASGARDHRAKARVTFALPAAIWNAFRARTPEPR